MNKNFCFFNKFKDRHADATVNEKKLLEKKFKEIGEAYNTLSNAQERLCYDNSQSTDDDTEPEPEFTHPSNFFNDSHDLM